MTAKIVVVPMDVTQEPLSQDIVAETPAVTELIGLDVLRDKKGEIATNCVRKREDDISNEA